MHFSWRMGKCDGREGGKWDALTQMAFSFLVDVVCGNYVRVALIQLDGINKLAAVRDSVEELDE